MRKLIVLGLCLVSTAFAQKFPGLALTPPMGFNTWNTFASNIDEMLIKETADLMVKNGMRDAGYIYLVIDDCWAAKQRDAQGNLVADPVKFPNGIKALADYVHAKGMKLGIYSCAGARTCGDYPGSWGHEFQDARTFASWGIDYLKYDWCNTGTANPKDAYLRMRDGLYAAGRPVIFSICEWGGSKPWEWAADVGHLWRTTGDIYDSYDGRKGWESGWKRLLDMQYNLVENSQGWDGLAKFGGPGHWNDPDMLEVGNEGLTFAESRAHFSLWCVLAAPLMAGNDIRKMTPEITALMTDKDAIAIDQDPLGKCGFRVAAEPANNIEVWAKELSNGEWAFCALNTSGKEEDITIKWDYFGWILKGQKFALTDVWAKKAAGDTSKHTTVHLASHDVALFRLKPVK